MKTGGMMRIGLRTQLLAPTMAILIIGIALSSWFSSKQAADALRDELVDSTEHILETASIALSTYNKSVAGGVKVLARDETIQRMCAVPGEGLKLAANRLLKEAAESFPNLYGANLVGLDGTIIASSDPEEVGTTSSAP